MKKNKREEVNVKRPINVSIHLLPFGQMKLNCILGGEELEVKKRSSVYVEPLTTNIENINVLYSGKKYYHIPDTTA